MYVNYGVLQQSIQIQSFILMSLRSRICSKMNSRCFSGFECASKMTWPMHAKVLVEQAMKDWYPFEKDWKAPELEEYSHDHWHPNYA